MIPDPVSRWEDCEQHRALPHASDRFSNYLPTFSSVVTSLETWWVRGGSVARGGELVEEEINIEGWLAGGRSRKQCGWRPCTFLAEKLPFPN